MKEPAPVPSAHSADVVRIFDTTLRDGEQSPGASMTVEEKLRVAHQLERLGVDVIEAGFPIASPGDFEAVARIAAEIRTPVILGLARTGSGDIDRALAAVEKAARPGLHTFIATSEIHMKHKLGKTRAEVLDAAVAAVRRARAHLDHVEFSAEDATRSELEFLVEIFSAVIEAGATVVNVPDTVGYTMPVEYGRLIRDLRDRVPGIDRVVMSAHCHDDLGLAVANSLIGVLNGVRQIECTVNGIGERAGNASLEEIVMSLKIRRDIFGVETRVHTEQIVPASRLVSAITGIRVPPNKAVVGANAFMHESGIHQDGVLKEKLTYEIMTPQSVGLATNHLVMGKHSGRHAFRERLKDLGFGGMTEDQLQEAFNKFKVLADRKKEIFDEDLEALVLGEVLRGGPSRYKLVNMSVTSGTLVIPSATVQLEVDGKTMTDAGFGDGPVDAAFKTISRITGEKPKLVLYAVNAITRGTDAQGEVTVRLEKDGVSASGKAAHTDIIQASALAYVDALNRLALARAHRLPAVETGP